MRVPDLAPLIAHLPAVAQEVFIAQWNEARWDWERADVLERVELTLQFYAEHEWDEATQRWISREPTPSAWCVRYK